MRQIMLVFRGKYLLLTWEHWVESFRSVWWEWRRHWHDLFLLLPTVIYCKILDKCTKLRNLELKEKQELTCTSVILVTRRWAPQCESLTGLSRGTWGTPHPTVFSPMSGPASIHLQGCDHHHGWGLPRPTMRACMTRSRGEPWKVMCLQQWVGRAS